MKLALPHGHAKPVRRLLGEILRFSGVGIMAMLLHLAVVSLIVPLTSVTPLAANAIGFLVAFQVGYIGHTRWTFGVKGGLHAYGRMFAVSLASFAINEGLYALLLCVRWIDYRVSLAGVLLAVACFTYLGSRFWALRQAPGIREDVS